MMPCVMPDTLSAICAQYHVTPSGLMPIEIKNMVRDDLPQLFALLGFTRGAEVGVWHAEFAVKFCQAGLHMTAVDSWIPYREYRDHRRPHKIAAAYDIARAALAPYPHRIIRKFSVDAAPDVPDGSLDFVYIDANHSYESALEDLTVWSPKVRRGGIISGHDYDVFPRDHQFIHVREAVEAFIHAHSIAPWFILGRRKVRPGERHEFPRSFMWVQS